MIWGGFKMAEEYGVGLDIGSSSVGWTVVDSNGRIKRVKGKTAIGVRLFKEGKAAADRRSFRSTRRRMKRVRWRLRLLREIFDEPINKIDSNFFARRKYSAVSPRDPQYNGLAKTIFNDRPDKEFYTKYPTIYHLRQALMTEKRQFDIREIYLAMHHIVKYRGNFLRSGNASAYQTVSLNFTDAFKNITALLMKIDNELDLKLTDDTVKIDKIKAILLRNDLSRSDQQKQIVPLMYRATGVTTDQKKQQKSVVTEVAKALVGNKANVATFTMTEIDVTDKKDWSFEMGSLQDALPLIESSLDESAMDLLETVADLHDAINLAQLIPEGLTFSQSMMMKYEQHKSDLKLLKDYIDSQTDRQYGRQIRETYDQYIGDKNNKAITQDEFYRRLGAFTKKDGSTNQFAAKINVEIKDEIYMPKLRTKRNGSIPYQVHQNELDQIINNQKKYYPWLAEKNPVKNHQGKFPYKLDELISFRVPYYVGPMITEKEQLATSDATFAWMVRKQSGPITPWNFDEKVDREASATAFIQRMRTTDTYLIGEEVLPKQSLIYQRFAVLNELNKIKIDDRPITLKQKQRLYEQVFKNKKIVSVKNIQHNLIVAGEYPVAPVITGLSDPKRFNNSLSTYNDLERIIPDALADPTKRIDVEKIILWSTIFEDNDIFMTKLTNIRWLTVTQREQLSQIRYRGWGQLSKKLLVEFKDDNGRSIIKALWETNANFMELRSQPKIAEQIKNANTTELDLDGEDAIQNLYTSPQNKKAIREVMLVLSDIKKAMGQDPSWIFVEAARGGGQKKRRTQTRASQIEAVYQSAAKEIVDVAVRNELQDKIKDKAVFNDRLVLYFMQNGHDIYTGKPLNIDRLSEYDIDHILPQSFIKDDSLDNRVLTNAGLNREKNDTFAMVKFGKKMAWQWRQWHKMGLITGRKLRHLTMRPTDIDKYAAGFVNRQLVETRQIIKLVTRLLDNTYSKAKIVSVKANLTHQFRVAFDLPKLRDVNDYHHGFDAYLTAFIGTYLLKRYPALERFFVYGKFEKLPINLKHFNIIGNLVIANSLITIPETGEVIWDEVNDIKMMHKIYNFKRFLITREVYENHGQLFNQTLYKAKENRSRALIPKKNGADTDIYGGYSGKKSSYLAIVKVPEKKEYVFRVVSVPVMLVTKIKALVQSGLTEKAALTQLIAPIFTKFDKKANAFKTSKYEVILPQVRFDQVIRDEVNGRFTRFALGTDTYYHNIQELYLPLKTQRLVAARNVDNDPRGANLMQVFEVTLEQINQYFPLYDTNQFRKKLFESHEKFAILPTKDTSVNLGKEGVLHNVFEGIHANATTSNLGLLGIKTPFGKLQVTSGLKLSSKAEIVYQSATGLYERKVCLRDL